MRIISWPNTDPAHLLSTLSPERYRSGPKTRYEASGAELPRWSFHPLEIMSFSCRTQTKFHTARWRFPTWRSTVFAHESSTRSARFDAENRLYCFVLTVPNEIIAEAEASLHADPSFPWGYWPMADGD